MNDSALDRIFDAADSLSADDLRGPIRDELKRRDTAWARLMKAERAMLSEEHWFAPEACAEEEAARQALRDVGVDVDALLEEK
jgi:hypothetical protein